MTAHAHHYCQEVCRKSASNFSLATRFLEKEAANGLQAFYAYCRLLDDIVDENLSDTEAAQQLAWWKEELERIYHGTPQHQVGIALAPYLKKFLIPQTYLEEIRLGCAMDLEHKRYQNFAELEKYCYRVASCVGIVCLYFFGITPNESNIETAVNMGKALQFTNILRDIREDAGRCRVYLPQELLQKYHLQENSIKEWKSSKNNWLLCLNEFIRNTRNFYQTAFSSIEQTERKKWLPAFIMAKIYQEIFKTISRQPLAVFEKRVSLPKWKKLWIVSKILWTHRFSKS